jgi:transcriptional regulator with XRE-family HTH domain
MSKLLEIAKEKQGFKSYYEMANALGISQERMSKWKLDKAKPNGEQSLMLADLAGISPKEALEIMRNGFINLSILILTGFASVIVLALLWISEQCILCKIDDSLKVRTI